MKPPSTITPQILNLVASISQILGQYEGLHTPPPEPKMRRQNRIKTIRGSLQIEGNTLSTDQVTAILDKRKVLGPPLEIREVQNAINAYAQLKKFDPYSIKSFCEAHGLLMTGLLKDAGHFRTGNVGILKGTKVSHLAPKPQMVYELIQNLFSFLKNDKANHFLIKSSIAHYEIEFIHPFSDGNGRLGRLWQTVLLSKFNPVFEYLPIESTIKDHQKAYYAALEHADKQGDSAPFIEFMLKIIQTTLQEFLASIKTVKLTSEDRVRRAKDFFGHKEFSRKDYLAFLKGISAPTASRDLFWAVENKLLKKKGQKNQTVYSF